MILNDTESCGRCNEEYRTANLNFLILYNESGQRYAEDLCNECYKKALQRNSHIPDNQSIC